MSRLRVPAARGAQLGAQRVMFSPETQYSSQVLANCGETRRNPAEGGTGAEPRLARLVSSKGVHTNAIDGSLQRGEGGMTSSCHFTVAEGPVGTLRRWWTKGSTSTCSSWVARWRPTHGFTRTLLPCGRATTWHFRERKGPFATTHVLRTSPFGGRGLRKWTCACAARAGHKQVIDVSRFGHAGPHPQR
jgi:hypothetical protein